MAIELISKIKQKNSGQFFLVDAADIDIKSGGDGSAYPDTSLENFISDVPEQIAVVQDDLNAYKEDNNAAVQANTDAIAAITAIPDATIIALFS